MGQIEVRGTGTRVAIVLFVALTLLLFIVGNAHLFYVAFDSAPACVDHVKLGQSADGGFTAAQSAC